MGIFDLRCKLSGLSTAWPGLLDEDDEDEPPESLDWSLLLLEEIDGIHVPLTLPTTGVYDRSGTLEYEPRHRGPLADWVEHELDALHRQGILTVDEPELAYWRQRSRRHSNFGDTYPCFLGLGSRSIAPAHPDGPGPQLRMWMEGRPVQPCLFLAEVAGAIAASPAPPRSPVEEGFHARLHQRSALRTDDDLESEYAAWLLAEGRPRHAAYLRAQHERHRRGFFLKPPAGSAEVAVQLHRVLQWAEPRGGLWPVQHDDSPPQGTDDGDEIVASARQAWTDGDPIVRSLIEVRRPDWVAGWRADGPAPEPAASVPYRPAGRYAVGDLVTHTTFGLGRVEHSEGGKVRVRFGAEV
ncbi:MAG: hypothetical protein EOO75_11125, partial [Myxococcales bacterium]